MFSLNDKISIRQMQILLILDIFGMGVIMLPRKAAEFAAQDGWIIIIISTLLAALCMYIITSLSKMFPEKSFFEYSSIILGKPIGLLLSIGLVVKIVLNLTCELRLFGEIVKQTLLYNTPFSVIGLSILLVAGYVAGKGYETRARLAEILIFIVFIPLIIVFGLTSFTVDFTNIMPIMKTQPVNLFKGAVFCMSAFTGIEVLLMSMPYITKPENARKGSVQAVFIIGLFMTLITIITIAKFGPFDIQKQTWPVMEMMDTVDLPGSFIERQEGLIISFWIISVFAIVNAGLFFTSLILKSVIKKGKHKTYIYIVTIVIFILTLKIENMFWIYNMIDSVFLTFGIAYMAVIPAILLAVAKWRGLGVSYAK